MAPKNFSLWVFHLHKGTPTCPIMYETELDHLKSLGLGLGEAFEETGSIHGGCPCLPPPPQARPD